MAVGINIISDFDGKGIQKAIAQFKKLETSSEKAAFVLKKAFLPAVAALGGLAFAGVKAAQAAAQDEIEQAKLAQTLEKVVGATSATVASTEQLIETMSRASGTADTELREALSSLVIGSGDLTKAQKGLALAQDIATASNIPLGATADALAKAYAGNYKALQKLSPALRDLIKDGASTEVIFQSLSDTFGGATANAATTASGKMKILKNNFSELQESIGAALLPALEKVTAVLSVVVGFLADHQTTVIVFAAGIGLLAVGIIAFNIALSISTIVMQLFGASAAAASAAAAPIALIVAGIVIAMIAVGAAVIYAYTHFETFRKVINTVINFVIGYVEFLVNAYIKGINLIIDGINLLVKAANFFGAGLPKIAKIGEVAFGRVGEATNHTEQQLKNLERQAMNTAGALRLVVTPEAQLKTQSDRYTAIALSLGKLVDYTGKGYKAISSGGGVVESASEKLSKYVDAIKGVTTAQRGLRDANKQLNDSNKSLLEKTQALAEAQKRFNLITNGYGSESKQAKDADRERSKAQRGLERANYGLEQAVFAVKDAEKALADLRKDPAATPQAIREAEIALASAKLSVADATDTQHDSTQALTDAQLRLDEAINGAQVGSETYKDAVLDLVKAQKDQVDANDAVTAALERQTDAVKALADAEEKRRDAAKGVPAAAREAADIAETFKGIIADSGFTTPFTQEQLDDLGRVGRGDFGIPMLSEKEIEELYKMFPPMFMANGGVVTKATNIIAGERGAEAIIPLDRMGSFGSTYNIQVTAGMGADGKDIGTQIVNALKRYERTNGALPLTVA